MHLQGGDKEGHQQGGDKEVHLQGGDRQVNQILQSHNNMTLLTSAKGTGGGVGGRGVGGGPKRGEILHIFLYINNLCRKGRKGQSRIIEGQWSQRFVNSLNNFDDTLHVT